MFGVVFSVGWMEDRSLAQVAHLPVCVATGVSIEAMADDEVGADEIFVTLWVATDTHIL